MTIRKLLAVMKENKKRNDASVREFLRKQKQG